MAIAGVKMDYGSMAFLTAALSRFARSSRARGADICRPVESDFRRKRSRLRSVSFPGEELAFRRLDAKASLFLAQRAMHAAQHRIDQIGEGGVLPP